MKEAKDTSKSTAGRKTAKDKCLSKKVITEILTTIVCYLTGECKIADKRQLREEKKILS